MKAMDSFELLKKCGVNTPEPLYTFPVCAGSEYSKHITALTYIVQRLNKKNIQVCVRTDSLSSVAWASLKGEQQWDKLEALIGNEPLVVFKSPEAKIEIIGVVEVTPYYARIEYYDVTGFDEDEDQEPERVSSPWENLPPKLSQALSPLRIHRMELDGLKIEFTIHRGVAGTEMEQTVFWGAVDKFHSEELDEDKPAGDPGTVNPEGA